MSCYVSLDDHEVWNPSNTVARLFVAQATALGEIFNNGSGVGRIVDDEVQIDASQFAAFVASLVGEYERSNNHALRSLVEGFLGVSLVILERAQYSLSEFAQASREFWEVRTAEIARSMPT